MLFRSLKGHTVTIPGNLTVQGTTTAVQSTNTELTDNVITLNKGEEGAGVSLGTAGIAIDRGTEDIVRLVWNEDNSQFEFQIGSGDATVFAGTLKSGYLQLGSSTIINEILDEDDFASDSDTAVATQQSTKQYIADVLSGYIPPTLGVYEEDTSITVSDTGSDGTITFTLDGTVKGVWTTNGFDIDNLTINNDTISTSSNGDIVLSPNGTGAVVIDSVFVFNEQGSDPTAISGTTTLYAKVPTINGSGIFVNNSTNGVQELISKKRARLFGLVF